MSSTPSKIHQIIAKKGDQPLFFKLIRKTRISFSRDSAPKASRKSIIRVCQNSQPHSSWSSIFPMKGSFWPLSSVSTNPILLFIGLPCVLVPDRFFDQHSHWLASILSCQIEFFHVLFIQLRGRPWITLFHGLSRW